MTPRLALASLLLTFSLSFPVALAQAPSQPPPSPPAPAQPPASAAPRPPSTPIPPATTPPPAQPVPSQPPPATPMTPLVLHDPSDQKTLENLVKEEQDLQKQINDFVAKVNATLGGWNDQMLTIQKVAQDNWGADVVYNRQTGKFERPASPAGKKEEKK